MVLQQSIDEVRLTQRNGWLVMRNSTNHPGSIEHRRFCKTGKL
jgi:hypothetical protein